MKRTKTKNHKKSLIAEAIIPYTATSLSFEDLIDNITEGDNLTILKLIPGNEKTVEQYIGNLIHVFSECIRILRKDGSIIFNRGDKYLEGSLQLIPYRFAMSDEYYYNLHDYMNHKGTRGKHSSVNNTGRKYFELIEKSDLTAEQKKMALQ